MRVAVARYFTFDMTFIRPIIIAAVSVLAFACTALGYFLFIPINEYSPEVMHNVAAHISKDISSTLTPFIKRIESIAQNKETIALFKYGDPELLKEESKKISTELDVIENFQYLLPGQLTTEDVRADDSMFGFADLALLKRAETSTSPLPIEFHSIGSYGERLSVAKRVKDSQEKLVGIIYFVLPTGLVKKALLESNPNIETDLYIELHQMLSVESALLLEKGENKYRTPLPDGHARVKYTRWHIFVWAKKKFYNDQWLTLPEQSNWMWVAIIILLFLNLIKHYALRIQILNTKLPTIKLRKPKLNINVKKVASRIPIFIMTDNREDIVYDGAILEIINGIYSNEIKSLIPYLPKK